MPATGLPMFLKSSNWANGNQYFAGEVQRQNSTYYLCIADNINQSPHNSPTYWRDLTGTGQAPIYYGGPVVWATAGGRLTLDSNDPTDTGDKTNISFIYYRPFSSESIGLYNGADWEIFNIGNSPIGMGLSISMMGGAAVANKNYDVFMYLNAGVPTLTYAAWTNDSTRASALVLTDGVWTLANAAYRYVGSFRLDGATRFRNTLRERFVYNADNQLPTQIYTNPGAASHSYAVNSVRKFNNTEADSTAYALIGKPNQHILMGDVGCYGNSGSAGDAHLGLWITTNPAVLNFNINSSLVQSNASQVLRVPATQQRLAMGLNHLVIIQYVYAGTGFYSYPGHNLSLSM